MKYGDIFYVTSWGGDWHEWPWYTPIKCRFRIDPVPGRGKRIPYKVYYRKIRTTQERRMSLVYPEYTRVKRNMRNLPTTWDDIYRNDSFNKCWKHSKKRKQ